MDEQHAFTNRSLQYVKKAYSSKKMEDIQWNCGFTSIQAAKMIINRFIPPKSKILDIGCGLGDHSIMFALNQMDVVGIDIMEQSIKIATQNAKLHRAKVHWVLGDALNMEFENNTFDVAYDQYFFHNLKKSMRIPFAKEISRVLKCGGFYTMIGFSDKMEKGSGPYRLTSKDIIKSFNRYFNCEHLEYFESLPINGRPQQIYWFSIWQKKFSKAAI